MNDALLYRRQFFLGPTDLPGFPSWQRLEVAGKLRLAVHPDLPLTHVASAASGGKSLTLLGYLLDPDRPEATDRVILERLLGEMGSAGELPLRTSRLGGRFALVAHDGARTVIFQDAGGLRQVYYTARPGGGVACAAQSGLLAEVFGFSPDPAALDYLRSRGDRDTEVYWLPGDRSAFEPVRALLPNHVLDLDSGTALRFWPTSSAPGTGRGRLSAAAGLRESAKLLHGQMAAARKRYPLAVAMTAGWDSRLMLALAKDARAALYCYTLIYPNASVHSRDVWVPAKLLKRLGLSHHLLRYPSSVDTAFKEVARRSSSAVHAPYCADVQALRDDFPADHLCVTGDVAEVVKVHYRLEGKSPTLATLTVKDLGAVAKVEPHPFADAAFASWLEDARKMDASALGDVNVLDVFNWEQMSGRWQGHIRAEYDIVHESLAPLACRELLLTMLAVDESERRAPGFPLFRALIEEAWPELLRVPINPREKVRWRRVVVSVLRRLRVYDLGKRIVRKIA